MERIRLPGLQKGQSILHDQNEAKLLPSDWESQVKNQIRKRYARQVLGLQPNSSVEIKMAECGYTKEMLACLPNEVLVAFSGCGNPISLLELTGSEIVVDLGCGSGIDSLLAGQLIHNGMVISVDFTSEFLELLDSYTNGLPIKLINADLEHLPLVKHTADIVMSNAVFNLTTNKEKAYAEAFRILKPGGKLVMFDLILDKSLPREVIEDPLAYTTSLGGVENKNTIQSALEAAGFVKIKFGDQNQFSLVTSVSIIAQKKHYIG